MTPALPIRAYVRDLVLETPSGFRLEVPELEVRAGEIVAVVGANGSGKSTFIEALLGLRRAMRGDIGMLGTKVGDVLADRRRLRRLGCQLQNNRYVFYFQVGEILRLHRALYGRSDSDLEERLGVTPLRPRIYNRLSRGERQRVDLFVALGHGAELLVLDEPSTGLDRNYAEVFSRIMLGLSGDGQSTAVVMASHRPEEIALAHRIVVLHEGRILGVLDMPGDLGRVVGKKRFELRFRSAPEADAAVAEFAALKEAVAITRDEQLVRVYARDDLNDRILARYGAELTGYSFADVDVGDLLEVASRGNLACFA